MPSKAHGDEVDVLADGPVIGGPLCAAEDCQLDPAAQDHVLDSPEAQHPPVAIVLCHLREGRALAPVIPSSGGGAMAHVMPNVMTYSAAINACEEAQQGQQDLGLWVAM